MSGLVVGLVVLTGVGCGAIGGAFFVFSVMVMPALRRLPAARAVAVMRSINAVAVRPGFLAVFLGTGLLSAGQAGWAIWHWHQPGSGYLLAAGLLYLIGAIGLTGGYHVPRNLALDALPDNDIDRYWPDFARSWTAGNHVRALAALGAGALCVIGLVLR